MPQTQIVKEYLKQPIYSGWRIDKENKNEDQPLEHMNLFVSDLGNIFKTNMKSVAALVSDRSALIRRVGVFASFDTMEDYEEFWLNCSFDLILGHRVLHTFDMKDVEVPEEHGRRESGSPKPTHNYGYMGWFSLELPIETAPRGILYTQLHSSPRMVKTMEELLYSPRQDFAGATVFLDTVLLREVQ